ncbi:MAG: hypothetical protein HY912_18040 [Desulfomonile tiedjei]|uniref:Uncharacterized protein n=1 Tax=Desulfomonile tiedjei TaxID=2358 RepID=A0A9D6V9E9_9BACT|nr:hypothetical protein [Desulfomonile tiedjei]
MRKIKAFWITFVGFFLVLLWGNVATAQDNHFQDRDSCMANCRAMAARGDTYVGDRRVDPRMVYAMCVQKCDKRFWKDVEGEEEDE